MLLTVLNYPMKCPSRVARARTGAGSNLSNTWLSDGDNLGVMRLLITTPTGNIGSRVSRDLVELGTTSVRVIVRDPGKLTQSLRGSIDIVEGSHDDPNTIGKALEGVDAMFWCQPDSIVAEDYYGFYRRFASAGYEAIRRERTPRFVALSATGGAFRRQSGTDNGSSRNGGHSGAIGRARSLSALRLIL